MNDRIHAKLNEGIAEGVFPNAELLVSHGGKVLYYDRVGCYPDPERAIFDLASLTKPLCTAITAALFFQENKIRLDDPVTFFFSTATLKHVTIRELLNHTSGIADWAPLYSEMLRQPTLDFKRNKKVILEIILNDDNLIRVPGRPVYSDLGYILLGAILEKVGKGRLDHLFKTQIAARLGLADSMFFVPLDAPPRIPKEQFVPTEVCALRKKTMQGEVMDRNCYVQGGVSGHAGLFSNAQSINRVLSELRQASLGKSGLIKKDVFDLFCRPDPRRAWDEVTFTLGFETTTKGKSQSGTFFSKNSIGHLGYAGTSFWWDLDRDFWVILLTNRCLPDRKNFKIQQFRPALHDFVITELELLKK